MSHLPDIEALRKEVASAMEAYEAAEDRLDAYLDDLHTLAGKELLAEGMLAEREWTVRLWLPTDNPSSYNISLVTDGSLFHVVSDLVGEDVYADAPIPLGDMHHLRYAQGNALITFDDIERLLAFATKHEFNMDFEPVIERLLNVEELATEVRELTQHIIDHADQDVSHD